MFVHSYIMFRISAINVEWINLSYIQNYYYSKVKRKSYFLLLQISSFLISIFSRGFNWIFRIPLVNFRVKQSGQRIFMPRSRCCFAFLRSKTRNEDYSGGESRIKRRRRRRNRTAVSHGGSTTHRKLMWIPRNWSPRYSPAGTVFLYLPIVSIIILRSPPFFFSLSCVRR